MAKKASETNHKDEDLENLSPVSIDSSKSVGATLYEARRAKKKEIDRIAKELRISADKLRAMEEDNFSALPGRVYAIGFLRTYSIYLGLNPDDMIAKFKTETHSSHRKQPLVLPAAPPPKRMPGKQIMMLAATLFVVFYTIYYLTTSPLPQQGDEPVAENDVPAEVVTDLKDRDETAVAGAVTEELNSDPTVQSESTDALKDDVNKAVAELQATPPAAAPAEEAAPTDETAAAATEEAVAVTPAPAGEKVTLVAKSENWVQIVEENGVAVLSKVMSAGETFDFSLDKGLTITTGNAGALEIKADGSSYPLGKNGQVLQNYKIDLAKLKS